MIASLISALGVFGFIVLVIIVITIICAFCTWGSFFFGRVPHDEFFEDVDWKDKDAENRTDTFANATFVLLVVSVVLLIIYLIFR